MQALTKSLPAERFRAQTRALAAAIDRNAAWVGRARDAVTFSPKDSVQADSFLASERVARKVSLFENRRSSSILHGVYTGCSCIVSACADTGAAYALSLMLVY